LCASLLALSIAFAPSFPAAAAEAKAVVARISIDNFGQISDTYFRGSQPEGREYAALAALGVKTVVDLQADFDPTEEGLVESAGMTFHRIPMTTRKEPTAADLIQFLEIVNDPANQPVYVHCAGGKHRTGVMTAVYRMSHDGWSSEQAFKEMKKYKFGADFLHPEFKRFVYGYQVPLKTAELSPAPALVTAAAP
jgi:protein tyrosine/serine phosphatase